MGYSTIHPISFTQDIPSNEWNITHNMNTQSIVVDVFVWHDGKLTKMLPLNVTIIDNNNIKISFSNNHSGVARLA